MNNAASLTIGTRVYYTGDMANASAEGTIVAIREDKRFGNDLQIRWDAQEGEGPKPDSFVFPVCFKPAPGRRFMTIAERNAEREKLMADMQARYARG